MGKRSSEPFGCRVVSTSCCGERERLGIWASSRCFDEVGGGVIRGRQLSRRLDGRSSRRGCSTERDRGLLRSRSGDRSRAVYLSSLCRMKRGEGDLRDLRLSDGSGLSSRRGCIGERFCCLESRWGDLERSLSSRRDLTGERLRRLLESRMGDPKRP
jgi:hypothetical protein